MADAFLRIHVCGLIKMLLILAGFVVFFFLRVLRWHCKENVKYLFIKYYDFDA